MSDLVYRLRKRAEIRRQIPDRKSVQEGKSDRIADLLEEAADYIDQAEKQEPVAWKERHTTFCNTSKDLCDGDPIPLYTAPPKREWVGLTDDEIKEIIGPWGDTPIKGYTRELFDKIEAKLKEKNRG